ncbi:MAG: Ig-like domain-containing protein, partial [Planctomycetota bacterium]
MPALLRKRWVWVTALFAVINVLGLWAIVQAIEGRGRRLRVERFLPEGVASTQSIVSVRFDQPMVTRSQIGEPVAEGLLDVFPPVPGGAAWSDTRTATFEPTEELRRATPYTVTVSREFTSLLGHGLGRDHTFEFHTPRLDLLSVRQTGRSRNASLSLSLSFSDRVRPEDLREHLDLRDIADEPLAWSLGGRVPTREVRILTRPYREQWLTATVTKGLQGVSGPLGLLDDRTVRLQVESGLKVTHLSAYARSPEDVAVRVHCTQRVDAEGAAKFIEVEPAVEFQAYSAYGGLRLRGPFGPGKRYRFTFLKGLCGEDGAVLDQKTVRAVTIPDCRPSVCFKTRGLYLSARGQMLLPLETVNVEKVELTLERVYPNNVVHYLRERRGHRRGPDDLSHVVVERTVAVEGPRNQAHVEPLDLRGLLAERSHGLFLARAEDAKHPWTRDQQVLVVTDLGLSAKRSETGLLVWVCGLSASQPVPGAKVAVFTRANQRVLSGTTDARGIAHFSDADLAGDRAPYAVAATRGDDTGIVVLGETGVDISDCDTGGRPYLRQG